MIAGILAGFIVFRAWIEWLMKPGTYVALFMLTLAVLATGANFWFQRHRAARPLTLWGAEPARLIGLAGKVEALRIAPENSSTDSDSSEVIEFNSQRLRILEINDASESRGIKNIRQGLLDSASYDWSAANVQCEPQWEYGLRFSDGTTAATLLFAPNCAMVALTGTNARASVKPTWAAFEAFLAEQFAKRAANDDRRIVPVKELPGA